MNVHHAVEVFCKYSSQEKTEFLLLLAHTLTVLARETYEAGGDGLTEPSRLRRINEVQHQVLNSLIALRGGGRKRYPDDVVVRLILEHPEDVELQRQLEAAVDRLLGERSATA